MEIINLNNFKSKLINSSKIIWKVGDNIWFKVCYMDGHIAIYKVKYNTYLYKLYSRYESIDYYKV